jgi:DNA sulfur modification protein DndB
LYAIMFGKQKIKALGDQEVAAIKGKAGRWTYYSFVATPEQLLKISYVHRRIGIHGLAGLEGISGTYQRMLKQSKLRSIDHFIEEDRFFPNSIIISFDRPPRFDLMSRQDLPFQYGILTLPNSYGSAWIIDGQHRLYGYAKNTRRETAPLPVIAFEKLPVDEQAKLFVEINQNQTPVERNLLWDLAGDIYEGSEDESQREDLTISRVVKHLNEMGNSPLKGHIFIPSLGKRSSATNVTMTTICQSIKSNKLLSADMFGHVKLEQRDFERFVAERIAAFLCAVQKSYTEDWQKGDSGYLRSNNGIAALFIVLRQLLKYLNVQDKQSLYTKSSTSDFETEASILLMSAIEYLKERPERSSEFRKRRGSAGQNESAFELCQKVKDEFDDFPLPRIKLLDLPKDKERAKPEDVDQAIKDTELVLREFIINTLKEAYGDAWYRKGLPGGVKNAIDERLEDEIGKRPYRKDELDQNREKRLEFTDIGHLRDIIVYGENWHRFEAVFRKKTNVETHFADYIDLRNAFRAHPREVDPVVWDKGRGAVRWIRKCLEACI